MKRLLQAAYHIVKWHEKKYDQPIGEMKLHKLLYFAQRESFIFKNGPLFSEAFQGWQYGPVLPEIRAAYWALTNNMKEVLRDWTDEPLLSQQDILVIDHALLIYGEKDAWSLSRLSHGETSWQRSRRGLEPEDRGHCPLADTDIEEDACRIFIRRRRLAPELLKLGA